MEQILITYYANNAKKLHRVVDKILRRFYEISDKDKDDFYSLANEVFVDVMKRYDNSKDFDGFLYSCLYNKIVSEIKKRHRIKREADRMSISIDAPIGDDENCTIGDMIADNITVEKEIFDKNEEGYSKKMLLYLSKLSNLQKEILRLNIAGYLPEEIRKELHISKKEYGDCYVAIKSYKNTKCLASLIRRESENVR